MSRNPSPAPAPPHNTTMRPKQKPFAGGINAGAEDVKYQAKYKELKRKVKDVENDNDKLQVKVMSAKLTIQRMKMERAILYERLALPPNSPSLQDRGMAAPSGVPAAHQREPHDASAEPDQPFPAYNNRARGTPAQLQQIEARPVSAVDTPGVVLSPHMSITHSPRRISTEHDPRQPRLQMGRPIPAPYDGPHPSRSHSSSHTSPPMEQDYPPPTHHIRTRSQSSSRSRNHQMQQQPSSYREGPYPEMQPQAFSPPLSHPDMRNVPSQADPHTLPHHQAQLSPRSSTSDLRSRIHPHQRVGPGTYINRDNYPDRPRDLDREEWDLEQGRRDLARNRDMPPSSIHSPHSVNRHRQPHSMGDRADYPEHLMSSAREEHPQYYDGPLPPSRAYPPHVSRSGTPGSASASGSGGGLNEESSRPESRATQYYDQERGGRPPNYRLRPVTQPTSGDDIDFVHEDGRPHLRADRGPSGGGNFPVPEQAQASSESRKRNRNDMDMDSEGDVVDASRGTGHYSTSRPAEDRGSKRYHRARRSMDALEDSRVGPS